MSDIEKEHKSGVATTNKTYEKYQSILSKASNEVFIQFFIRIYKEIPKCVLGSFSKLKYLNSTNFEKFRETFQAKFLKGFMCPAWTFDNVKGQFPIGFLVWNLAQQTKITKTTLDIFENGGEKVGKKNFYASNDGKNIGVWLASFREKNPRIHLAMMDSGRLGFQHQNLVHIANQIGNQSHSLTIVLAPNNLIPCCVFFGVRHAIKASWINDRDQFLHPNKKWQQDTEFQNDCLAFTLFHGQNRITSQEGINHFIPFSEKEVGAKSAFASDFIVRFINGKIKIDSQKSQDSLNLYKQSRDFIPTKPLAFSKEAKEVFKAGLSLWKYYHAQAKSSPKYINDASLYDIKEYFQGRSESKNGKSKGKMNARSEDSHYNDLLANLRLALNDLAQKIEPKIYEYEFLLE
ncbi:hypothetical protein [Helicobacter sp. T3_23-1059]